MVNEMREIRDQHLDLREGLDAHLGIKFEELAVTVPEFAQGIERSKGHPAERAQVMLDFMDVWHPVVEKYASYEAVVFMARDVSKYRRVAQLFEPIVYQAR